MPACSIALPHALAQVVRKEEASAKSPPASDARVEAAVSAAAAAGAATKSVEAAADATSVGESARRLTA